MENKTVLGLLAIVVVLPGLSVLSLFEFSGSGITEIVFVAVPILFVGILCYIVFKYYLGSISPVGSPSVEFHSGSRAIGQQLGAVIIAVLILTTAIVAAGFAGASLAGLSFDSAVGSFSTDDTSMNATGGTESRHSVTAKDVVLNYSIKQVPESGSVRITATVNSSVEIDGLEITLPEDAEHVRSRNLTRSEPDEADDWVINESTATPSVTYTAPVNTTDDDNIESVGVSEWALFAVSVVELSLDWSDASNTTEVTVARDAQVIGSGFANPGFAYLGSYQTFSHTIANRSIQMIVPEAATMTIDSRTVLDFLASSSSRLRVGARDRQLDVFVAPAPVEVRGRMVRAEYNGRQGILLSQDVAIADPDNGWLHEYVHTRQNYTVSEEMDWFDDASSEYYAALLTYQANQISFARFHNYVNTGKYADAELASLEPQPTNAKYFKGMRVLAALDTRIRAESGGKNTLEDVFRRMNAHEGTVSYEDFQAFVATAANRPLDKWLNRHLQSRQTATVPRDQSLFANTEKNASSKKGWLQIGRPSFSVHSQPLEAESKPNALN